MYKFRIRYAKEEGGENKYAKERVESIIFSSKM